MIFRENPPIPSDSWESPGTWGFRLDSDRSVLYYYHELANREELGFLPVSASSISVEANMLRRTPTGSISVSVPDVDTQGMGFAGLLKSELFGLRSTVDTETLRRLDRRNALYAMGDERTRAEDEEMVRLSDELSDPGFAQDLKDPYYALFEQKMAKHTKFHKQAFTPEEQQQQNALADESIDKNLAEQSAK